MYFAVNPTSPTLPAQIAQEIESLRTQHEDAPFHVIALVDGAFDEQFFKSYPRSRWPRHSLYANTSLQSLGAAAPQLSTFSGQFDGIANWLENLFSECSGKPMLSIIASALDAESLQRHFIPYIACRTEDTVEWPVRWGDTRVLPALMDSLNPVQREHMLSPIYCWWSQRRQGNELNWLGAGSASPIASEFDKFPMDEATFAALLELSEPDSILNSIYDNQPDILRNHDPVHAYVTVSRHLKIASAHHIEAASARHHFSVLSLILWDDFTEHPAMAEILSRVSRGSEYFEEISNLPSNFWEAAEEYHSGP
jgi:hypothetical protein